MKPDPSKCLPCLVAATGPFTTVTFDDGDGLNVSIDDVNRGSYDRLRLCRTTMDVDVGLGPLPAMLTYTAAWVLPPVAGISPLKTVEIVNRALFELLLGGIPFDAVAPEDVGRGFAYHTGYFLAASGHRGRGGVNFSLLRSLQSGDVSTHDSICLVEPRTFTVSDVNAALAKGRSLAKHLDELNPTVVLDGLTALRLGRTTSSLIFLWAASETLLNRLWQKHIAPRGAGLSSRKGFIESRAWTAAHKAEVLFQAGILDESLYEAVGLTRRVRNDVTHSSFSPEVSACERAVDVMFRLMALVVPIGDREKIAATAEMHQQRAPTEQKSEPIAWRHLPAVPGNEQWGDADYPSYPEREWVVLPPEARAELKRRRSAERKKR